MKTTIELPDELAGEAKRVAHQGGTTLRELVVAGLRSEIARRSATVTVDFSFPTYAGQGLVEGLAATDAVARSYEP